MAVDDVGPPIAELRRQLRDLVVRRGHAGDDVVVVANDLLQLKFTNASRDSVRFVANTVFGGRGLVDVASMRGLARRDLSSCHAGRRRRAFLRGIAAPAGRYGASRRAATWSR